MSKTIESFGMKQQYVASVIITCQRESDENSSENFIHSLWHIFSVRVDGRKQWWKKSGLYIYIIY